MEKILVLDFGGQYNQLIARRVRDHGVFAEILPYTTSLDTIRQGNYKGIIFTGGPNSVYDPASPHYTPEVLELGVPVLGICYGCQLMYKRQADGMDAGWQGRDGAGVRVRQDQVDRAGRQCAAGCAPGLHRLDEPYGLYRPASGGLYRHR